jgi:hypothetical protein
MPMIMTMSMNMTTPIPMTAKPIAMPTGTPIPMGMSTGTAMYLMIQIMTTTGFTAATTMIIPVMRQTPMTIPMIDQWEYPGDRHGGMSMGGCPW